MTLTRRNLMGLAGGLAVAGMPRPALAEPAGRWPASRRGTLAGPTFFVLGTFVAPPFEMEGWRSRGVNTVIGVGQGIDPDAHHETARRLGLAQIRPPRRGRLMDDLQDPAVIAFETDDEPTDLIEGRARDTPEAVRAQIEPWRAEGIAKPIFTNHVGDHILYPGARHTLDLPAYHRLSDWLGADTYQIAAGHGNLLTIDGSTSTHQGHILRIQRALAPDAALLSFVQTVAFNEGVPVPTPGQLRVQIWSAVVNGAAMVALFPVRLTPSFAWDGTPPELAAVIGEEFGRIEALGPALIDDRRGGTRPRRLHVCAAEGGATLPGQLPFPFEGCTVDAPGGRLRILINLSDSPALLLARDFVSAPVAFAPHEVQTRWIAS